MAVIGALGSHVHEVTAAPPLRAPKRAPGGAKLQCFSWHFWRAWGREPPPLRHVSPVPDPGGTTAVSYEIFVCVQYNIADFWLKPAWVDIRAPPDQAA